MSRTFNADVCTAITKSNSHRFYSANLYIPDQVECIASEVFRRNVNFLPSVFQLRLKISEPELFRDVLLFHLWIFHSR